MVFVAGMALPALAQTRPDFSGVWVPITTKAAPNVSGGVGALPPSDLTIVQTPAAIALSRTAFEHVTTETHTFDGHDNTNKSGAVTRVTQSHWNGAALVTEGKMSQVTSQGYAAWTLKQTLRLNAQGHLILDNESVGDDGKVTKGSLEYARKK
jgi:hypothetical protein